MICFVLGIPGSGKTALAVDHIIKNKNNDKYTKIYTNINQFDFSKINKAVNLDWDLIYASLTELYQLYRSKVTDDELIEYAKSHGLYKVLIVLDECHNYLDKKDAVLVWWLSYHRHLDQDIYLITQNLALVESKYKAFAEVFYRASPSFLRFRHHILKYTKFISSRMTKNDKFGIEKIDTKKNKVFDYYKSGDNSKGTNIILKYLSIAVFFLFMIIVMVYILFGSSDDKLINNSSSTVKNNVSPSSVTKNSNFHLQKKQIEYDNFIYMTFTCIKSECKFKDTTNYFDMSIVPTLAEMTNSSFFPLKIQKNTNIVLGAVMASPLLQHMFKERQNEKNTRDDERGLDLPLISR